MNVEFIVGTSNNNYNGTINFIHWNEGVVETEG